MTGLFRRFVPLLLAVVAVLSLEVPALAHNTFIASEPAVGATLDAAPSQLALRFAKPVPLDSASAEVIDAAGNRTEISPLTHGPGGDTEIVAPLPALSSGAVTLRWRLVGPDGHPLTGRVAFTISGGGSETPSAQAPGSPAPTFQEPWQAPGSVRWIVRWISYVAMIALVGILAAAAWILPSCWRSPGIRTSALVAVLVIGALGGAQVLMLAGDIAGTSPLSAWPALGQALGTTAGTALAIRVVVAAVLAVLIWRPSMAAAVRWPAVGGLLVVLLGSWAFAGHASSMRWAAIGVPLDLAHHAAAALWLGGLVVVSRLALIDAPAEEVIGPVQRFAQLAPIAVGVLVVTGIIQSIRLTGVPDLTLASTHTRLLVVKLLALALMLKVADINRRRVARRFADATRFRPGAARTLRRAMAVEFGLGLIVVALTAAMVVSPPPITDLPSNPLDESSIRTPF